jgi:hypothetical protein
MNSVTLKGQSFLVQSSSLGLFNKGVKYKRAMPWYLYYFHLNLNLNYTTNEIMMYIYKNLYYFTKH